MARQGPRDDSCGDGGIPRAGSQTVLACLKPDGSPYITVCWHEWREGHFWGIPRQRSAWAEFLAQNPAVSFVIEQPKTLGKVIGEGRADLVERPNVGGQWVPIATRMTYRYLGENRPTYLEPTLHQPRWLFKIKPKKWRPGRASGGRPSNVSWTAGGPTYEEAHASV